MAAESSLRPRAAVRAQSLTWLLFALPLVVLAVGSWRYRWMSDDGFINLRVVRQIQDGHGPVFNAGERVEASTSPLWVAVLTVADWVLPFSLEWIAVILGIVMTIAGAAFVMWGATQLFPDRDGDAIVVPTGIWVLAAFAAQWKFASSGLENGLFALWFSVSFAFLARWTRGRADAPPLWLATVVGLGPLIRPDLAVLAGLLLLAVVLTMPDWGTRLRFLAAAAVIPVAYEIFRMGYYGLLVPNTALAKEASQSWGSKGWEYVWDSGEEYWLWLPLAALVVGGYVPMIRAYRAARDRRRLLLVGACFVGGAAQIVYAARVGGGVRMVLPALTAIIAPVAVTRVDRSILRALATAVILVWAVVCAGFVRSIHDRPFSFVGVPLNAITLEDHGWQRDGPARAWVRGEGVYWGQQLVDAPRHPGLPPTVVASFGVGLSSYAIGTDVYVLDMLGLGDAFTSHLTLARRGVAPGHEKPLPRPWVAARLFADNAQVGEADLPLPPIFTARPLDNPRDPFATRVADAREALQCGELRALLGRSSRPMSLGRFIGNVWHAPWDTRERIPPEPADAVAKYCR